MRLTTSFSSVAICLFCNACFGFGVPGSGCDATAAPGENGACVNFALDAGYYCSVGEICTRSCSVDSDCDVACGDEEVCVDFGEGATIPCTDGLCEFSTACVDGYCQEACLADDTCSEYPYQPYQRTVLQ